MFEKGVWVWVRVNEFACSIKGEMERGGEECACAIEFQGRDGRDGRGGMNMDDGTEWNGKTYIPVEA